MQKTLVKTISFEPGTSTVKCKCPICGLEYYRPEYYVSKSECCSKECLSIWRKQKCGNKSPLWKGGDVKCICIVCGNTMFRKRTEVEKGWGKYCSARCRGIDFSKRYSGKNNPNYKQGGSFKQYCELFGNNLKRRVKAFWDNKCVLCNASISKDGTDLHVHHVDGNKHTPCDGSKPKFVCLCRSCHQMIENKNRFNKGDEYEKLFNKLIKERNGKSFLTCDEFVDYCLKN